MARPGGDSGVNPFSLPAEMQCFWLQEPVPERSQEERAQERQLKVWEKPTCTSKYSAIRKVRDEELPMAPLNPVLASQLAAAKGRVMEEERPDGTFLTTIATKPAVGLVDPLRKSEKDIRTYVQKKREVFLVHMACDNKRDEIVRLEKMAKAKEEALSTSQQMLDEDAKRFEEYLQDRIARAQKATRDSEAHAKKKAEKLQKIKNLKQSIAGVQSETAKLREVRDECARYKDFLSKLTPIEWKEEQKQIKMARKAKRKERWIAEQMAPSLEKLAEEEEKLLEKSAQEESEADQRMKRRGKHRRREDEEEMQQRQHEIDAKHKRIQKKREDDEKRTALLYKDESSDEEYELCFKEPHQLMDSFTELEELNLFLIQSSQETEQQLDEIHHTFEHTKQDMGVKVQQLKDNIKQLDHSIAQEKRRGEELIHSHAEKASTVVQDKKLASLASKVNDVYLRCSHLASQDSDTLQKLGSIESKIEELIQGLDEAYHQDSELVMRLEWQKERDRRERVRENRIKEQMDKQEERLRSSLVRSQAPVFKKAGKQVMYRSPPLRQERKVVKDTTDDEAYAKDHKVFAIYIDRKTGVPQTETPTIEEPRRGVTSASAPTAALVPFPARRASSSPNSPAGSPVAGEPDSPGGGTAAS
ncbi:unnamed protein product [Polarella glacialis]|uniref:DUF4200 domain-containing protein n=1 Tax=Polarella glacialis TaxID=89957 RepID=A0A813GAI9_POLGL|nr:unnamed protein product [Polarella glacialis]CAE8623785.1 unnamed protein product [Polarella glacialis]